MGFKLIEEKGYAYGEETLLPTGETSLLIEPSFLIEPMAKLTIFLTTFLDFLF
jgi:hypothetical protein